MRPSTRGRLAGFSALAVLGICAALAVADSLPLVSSDTVTPQGEVFPPVDAADAAEAPEGDVLGAQASSDRREAGGEKAERRKQKDKRRGEAGDDEAGDETAVLAALIPAGSGGGGAPLPCSDTSSCVQRVGRLITNVSDRLPDLPRIRECTSSIGGAATCFDFGGGDYLVGDGPADGQTELGFCTGSGYYWVSGPSLGGGTGGACPGERQRGRERRAGRRNAPATRECTSLRGGKATCFDFAGGNYIVSDSLSDGKGEFGFCIDGEYYYVSAPSAKGDAGARCPGSRAD